MSDAVTVHRLRRFLLLLAALLFVGTVAELLAAEHDQGILQLVPFALCALGLLALALLWRRPGRGTTLAVRVLMLPIAAGSVLGVYEHVHGNYAFVHEIRPTATVSSLLRPILTGADPILAPGVLAVGALMTIAATFAVPADSMGSVTADRPAPEQRRSASAAPR